MPDINGGYDNPSHAGSSRMGRNKELTDDWTLLKQAHVATARARKSTADGPMRPSIGNDHNGVKVSTTPPLRV